MQVYIIKNKLIKCAFLVALTFMAELPDQSEKLVVSDIEKIWLEQYNKARE
jgi:hypothetical protein